MKSILLGSILLFSSISALAQTQLSVGYLGHGVIRPGTNIGLHFDLKSWTKEISRKGHTLYRKSTFIAGPEIGVFSRPRFYTSMLYNGFLGLKRKKSDTKHYSVGGMGFGYLAQYEMISLTTNLQGEIIERNRELRNYLLPTLRYGYIKELLPSLSYHAMASYGVKLSSTRERAGTFFLELGFTFLLTHSKDSND